MKEHFYQIPIPANYIPFKNYFIFFYYRHIVFHNCSYFPIALFLEAQNQTYSPDLTTVKTHIMYTLYASPNKGLYFPSSLSLLFTSIPISQLIHFLLYFYKLLQILLGTYKLFVCFRMYLHVYVYI